MSGSLVIGGRAAAGARRRWALSMSTLLAWRNLAHDRSRLGVVILGVAFAVLLMAVQLSLLFGFADTAAGLVSHSGADLWICGRGTKNVDQSVEIPARRRFEAMEIPGVAWADKYIVHFAVLRRPDGGTESIVLVGYNVSRGLGGPWNVVEGSVDDLKRPDGIIVDDLYKEKLGITHVGQTVEINSHRARVVGFTHGVRTFVQSPYVFSSFNTAQVISRLSQDATKYVLVKLEANADPRAVKNALVAKMPGIDVDDNKAFALTTQVYWLFSTGAGMDLILAAFLGVVIGVVVTAQALYASAIDHLPEYATMRAMGAGDFYLRGLIIKQALIVAVVGCSVGMAIAVLAVRLASHGVAAMLLPLPLILVLGAITMIMCALAGLVAMRRVIAVNPTSIFR
jgi:putative ABC transport system permease protein